MQKIKIPSKSQCLCKFIEVGKLQAQPSEDLSSKIGMKNGQQVKVEDKVGKFKTMWYLECKPGDHTIINSIFSGETFNAFGHGKYISYLVFQKNNHQIMCNMDVRAVLIA